MADKRNLVQTLSKGGVKLTLPLIEQSLYSDRLRGLMMNELEKYLLAQIKAIATPNVPERVTQD